MSIDLQIDLSIYLSIFDTSKATQLEEKYYEHPNLYRSILIVSALNDKWHDL